MIDVTATVYPAVLIGLLALALPSFARRRAQLTEIDEFPEPSI